MNTPKWIVVHCSDESEKLTYDQFDKINRYHRDERLFPRSSLGLYVGYHALITGGKNYKCKEDTDEGAHCNQTQDGMSMNFQSLGVCWGGDGDIEYPSEAHYGLLQQQIWDWQDKYHIPNEKVKFHRYWATNKTCPGSLINDAWLKLLLTRPPVKPVEKVNTCTEKDVIIEQQRQEISKWKILVDSIISFLNKIR